MRYLLKSVTLVLLGCSTSTIAFAQPGLITGNQYTSPGGYVFQVSKAEFCQGTPNSFESEDNPQEVTCQTKKGIQAGLKATGIALSIATTVCAVAPVPVPIPAKVFLAGSTLLVGVVDFVVMNIPCQDRVDKKKQAEQFCAMLRTQGFACDVNAINIKDL